MAENVNTIKDATVCIKAGEKLVNFLQENVRDLIENNKKKVPENIQEVINNGKNLLNQSDMEWINQFLIDQRNANDDDILTGKDLDEKLKEMVDSNFSNFDAADYLKEKNKNLPYLNDLMVGSELILPENEVIERNPILAERIERLKKEQEEREYKAMTQNVDMGNRHIPEDSISYQMNMMNRHLIAVGQFLLSVGAGFAFGFYGVQFILGNLNLTVRLLLGISCALVIAIAEFYFLTKQLSEEESGKDKKESPGASISNVKTKPHID